MPSSMGDRYRDKGAFFDRLAPEWVTKDFTPDEQPRLERLLRAAELGPGMTVLEPGCGAGRLTRRLAQAVGPTGRVIAADVSAEMVAACRRANPDAPVEVVHAPVEGLDLAPGSVDRIVCFAVFPHLEDKAAALDRFAHWLAPHGWLIISHLMSSAELNDFHRHAHDAVAHDHLPPLPELGPMLRAAGLAVDIAVDEPGLFLVRARLERQGEREA